MTEVFEAVLAHSPTGDQEEPVRTWIAGSVAGNRRRPPATTATVATAATATIPFPSNPPHTMASRVAAMALAGARPTAHGSSSAADAERRAWTAQLSLNRRGTRGLIARASHRPSCASEVGAPELDLSR